MFMNAIPPPYLVHDSIRFSVLTNEGVYSFDRIDLLSHTNFGNFSHILCSIQKSIVKLDFTSNRPPLFDIGSDIATQLVLTNIL